MLKRKALERFEKWKAEKTSQALLVMGARQVGKTTLVRKFAHDNYDAVAEINFFDNRVAVETVSAAVDANDLFLRISVLSRTEIIPGRTLVFLDEIQEVQNAQDGKPLSDALAWVKFLVERTDCDYVLSGSLLGLDSFDTSSFPVGSLQTITMYPLDFEEFCWASGLGSVPMAALKDSLRERKPVPGFLHEQLMDTFYKYLLVGGMPDAVQGYKDSNDLMRVRSIQKGIVELYKADVTKYVHDKVEARQIKMVYEAIPGQLNHPNKRFKYSRLGKNLRFANLETAFDWLKQAGTALVVTKVDEPLFPLGLYASDNALKLYMNDVGLLTSMLMGDVDISILNRKSSINFGAIFENVAAQELATRGDTLHYFNTDEIGELDFVCQTMQGGVLLKEIKSGKNYRVHRALNNLLKTPNYSFEDSAVFYGGNVEVAGAVTYYPIYSIGFVK